MKNTLIHMFLETAAKCGDRPGFKVKSGDAYQVVTYREMHERARALAAGIIGRGVGYQDAVGLIADNRLEWINCDLAILMAGAADVPRGSDSTVPELAYILKHSDAVATFVENEAQLKKVMSMEGVSQRLKFIAVMDPAYRASGEPKITTLTALAEEGRRLLAAGDGAVDQRLAMIRPDDKATIIYTSGTTGEPKGVVLLHRNIMHNVRVCPPLIRIGPTDRFLSILPPWHIFERTVEYMIISVGASMAYTGIKTLAADMALEKPTYMASVPRIWETIYGRVTAAMAKEKPAKQKIFGALLSVSRAYVHASRVLTREDTVFHPEGAARMLKMARSAATVVLLWPLYRFAQKKFAAIRARTGGCLKAAISGGGALPAYVDDFFAAVGLTILEGYGLTETSPVIAVRLFERRVFGTVGPLVPEAEVKIVDDRGRVLGPGEKGIIKTRGELVMKGYYKRDDLTRQAIDAEGWLDTGDLGMWTVRGELAIRGRAKETVVLLGGENVEPNPIEDKITESRYISQVMVVGQDRKVLGALVVPDEENVRDHFQKLGRPLPPGKLSSSPEVLELIRGEMSRLITPAAGFRPFERISKFRLLDAEFKVGEELTHTLKKKRNVIHDKYGSLIQEMYG